MNRQSKLSIQNLIWNQIQNKRREQDEKWGKDRLFDVKATFPRVLGEEFGEVCRAINDNDEANLRDELLDVSATCVALLEQLTAEEYSKKEPEHWE